jgi:hypothetical protein
VTEVRGMYVFRAACGDVRKLDVIGSNAMVGNMKLDIIVGSNANGGNMKLGRSSLEFLLKLFTGCQLFDSLARPWFCLVFFGKINKLIKILKLASIFRFIIFLKWALVVKRAERYHSKIAYVRLFYFS